MHVLQTGYHISPPISPCIYICVTPGISPHTAHKPSCMNALIPTLLSIFGPERYNFRQIFFDEQMEE